MNGHLTLAERKSFSPSTQEEDRGGLLKAALLDSSDSCCDEEHQMELTAKARRSRRRLGSEIRLIFAFPSRPSCLRGLSLRRGQQNKDARQTRRR